MDIFTHALAPVILIRLFVGKQPWLRPWSLVAVGLAGAMPDLLNPHLSLEARHTSWSHGLPFWVVFSLLVWVVTRFGKLASSWKLALLISLAYLFHMICDSISGGVDWFYPTGSLLVGGYFVDPIYWVPLDVILFLTTYYLFRLAPMLEKARAKPRS